MKFRTEIQIGTPAVRIGYAHRILLLGSCFATEMADRLAAAKFRTACNPTGTLFNPASIAALIRRASGKEAPEAETLRRAADGNWFSPDTDTSFDSPDREQTLARIAGARERCRTELACCDRLIVTFGTARVYRLRETGAIVANCHREPQALFERQRLTVEQIVGTWSELFGGVLQDKQTILTVSPIRHLADGLEGNAVSKAVLRLAAEELAERHPNVAYFPAFEILTDDLRDYRFYAEDLVHPSAQAVEYVWEKFAGAVLTDEARKLLPAVEAIVRAARHIPRQPGSAAYRDLCRRSLARIGELEKRTGIDFSAERAHFMSHLCG